MIRSRSCIALVALVVLAAASASQAAVWYAKPDGSLFTVGKGATGETLRERACFPSLLAGRDVVGALVISTSTGKRAVVVASPDGAMLAQPEGMVHYRYAGSDKTAFFTRSPLTGWTYVIGKAHPGR